MFKKTTFSLALVLSGFLALPSFGQWNVSGNDLSFSNSGSAYMNDKDILFRNDPNHGIGYYGYPGYNKQWNNKFVDGPVLYGYEGGALGTNRAGSQNTALTWNYKGIVYAGGYSTGAAKLNSFNFEVGGESPSFNNGNATIYFHHHLVLAHQLRYTAGNFYLEAAGNGYGTNSTPNLFVGGSVLIGLKKTTATDAKLSVDGKIYCQELNVTPNTSANWLPDYVFKKDYKLASLSEVENYIKEVGHLKEVPSAEEVAQNGYKVGEMDAVLLKKIEELTLYIISQEKRLNELEKRK